MSRFVDWREFEIDIVPTSLWSRTPEPAYYYLVGQWRGVIVYRTRSHDEQWKRIQAWLGEPR